MILFPKTITFTHTGAGLGLEYVGGGAIRLTTVS